MGLQGFLKAFDVYEKHKSVEGQDFITYLALRGGISPVRRAPLAVMIGVAEAVLCCEEAVLTALWLSKRVPQRSRTKCAGLSEAKTDCSRIAQSQVMLDLFVHLRRVHLYVVSKKKKKAIQSIFSGEFLSTIAFCDPLSWGNGIWDIYMSVSSVAQLPCASYVR